MRQSPTIELPGVYTSGEIRQDHADLARDGVVLTLWGQGQDTRSIAAVLRVHQSVVANRLAWLRDQAAR